MATEDIAGAWLNYCWENMAAKWQREGERWLCWKLQVCSQGVGIDRYHLLRWLIWESYHIGWFMKLELGSLLMYRIFRLHNQKSYKFQLFSPLNLQVIEIPEVWLKVSLRLTVPPWRGWYLGSHTCLKACSTLMCHTSICLWIIYTTQN